MIRTGLRILLASNDPLWKPIAKDLSEYYGYTIRIAENTEAAWNEVLQSESCYHIALIDDDPSSATGEAFEPHGIELMQKIKSYCLRTQALIFTDHKNWNQERCLKALHSGAFRYLIRPHDIDQLAKLIDHVSQYQQFALDFIYDNHTDRDNTPVKILLVSTEEPSCYRQAAFLEKNYACFVDVSRDTQSAWARMQQWGDLYQIVLIDDIVAPTPDAALHRAGIEFMKKVKERWPDIPSIIFTSWEMRRAWEALETGAFRYLAKPFHEDELVALIDYAVRKQEDGGAHMRVSKERREEVVSSLL